MNDDDPERRIRELEPPQPDATVADEPPRTGLRAGWILLGLMIVALVVAGGAMLIDQAHRTVAGRASAPEFAGGGGSFTQSPPSPVAPPAPQAGRSISVAGVGKQERYNCADSVVSVSGVDNKVLLTGHCGRVDVSGVGNTVIVESSDAIVVSGMNNAVTYRDGNPELSKSGMNNTLQRG